MTQYDLKIPRSIGMGSSQLELEKNSDFCPLVRNYFCDLDWGKISHIALSQRMCYKSSLILGRIGFDPDFDTHPTRGRCADASTRKNSGMHQRWHQKSWS